MEESNNNEIILKNELENNEDYLVNNLEEDKIEILIKDNFEETKNIDKRNKDDNYEEKQYLKYYEEDKEEKKNLANILNKISNKLTIDDNENKTIDGIFQEDSKDEKCNFNSLFTIKKEKSISSLYFSFYFLLPLLIIINFIGIFQSISTLN